MDVEDLRLSKVKGDRNRYWTSWVVGPSRGSRMVWLVSAGG